jgi:hypothetical protein
MRKVAIFTEGQSEQIFVRNLLLQTIDCSKVSFKCFKLYAGKTVPARFDFPNPNAEVSFLIVNVGQDEKVLSIIKEREKDLIRKGFVRILGLRDMYSDEYLKRSPKEINSSVIEAFIDGWNSTIQNMSDPSKIKMHIAVMELEAWFLAIYHIFERKNSKLSVEYIESQLGINLNDIDPQTEFLKPSEEVNRIFQLVGLQYKKKEHDVESICSKINNDDIINVFENGRCSKFKDFYEELLI